MAVTPIVRYQYRSAMPKAAERLYEASERVRARDSGSAPCRDAARMTPAPSRLADVIPGFPPRRPPGRRRVRGALLGLLPPEVERRVDVRPRLGDDTADAFADHTLRRG